MKSRIVDLYRRTPIRYRITAALVCLMVGSILIAGAAGFMPNEQAARMDGRAKICESLAITATAMVADQRWELLETTLDGIAKRNDEIESLGLVDVDDALVLSIGPHGELYRPDQPITINQMRVPIFDGQDQVGQLQIRFADTGGWMGLNNWGSAWLLIAIVPACFLQFSFFLRKTLDSLDPSGAMPVEVEETLNTFSVGMFLLNGDGRIIFANRRIAETIGRERDSLVGLRATEMDWMGDEELPWAEAERCSHPVYDRIVQIKNGSRTMTFSVNCTPISGQGFFVSLDDITLLEENKAALAVARDQAEHANEAKSQFLANMSHEIRTPLGAVLGFTDVLRRGLVTDSNEAVGHLNMIHRSGSHLLELINDILDLSKIEAGHLQIETIDTSFDAVVLDVAETMKVRADEKSITLQTEFPTALPKTVQSDPTRLRQIITNLVGNAIKFTETGGVTIRVRLSRPASTDKTSIDASGGNAALIEEAKHDAGPTIVVDVIDTGVGMTPQQQSKIFEKFVQADSSTTRKFGGTGLGLSISRQLAEAMGGTLTVGGEIGVGSTFTLTLPVAEMSLAELVTPQQISAKQERRESAAEGDLTRLPSEPPILVVDDGEGNRRLIDLVLRRAGATVHCVTNGAEAIEAIDQNGGPADCRFGIILMDMQMPVMDGYEATRIIRRRGGTMPIVALTGNAMKGDREKCTDAGCDDFMAKPIQIDRLLERVASLLGGDASATETPDAMSTTEALEHGEDSLENNDNSFENDLTTAGDTIHPTLPMDDEDFRAIAQDFVDRLETRLDQMQQLASEMDGEALASEAHWLKGAGGTVGLQVLSEPAKQLESLAKSGDFDAATGVLREIIELRSRVRCQPSSTPPAATAIGPATDVHHGDIRCSLPIDQEDFREIAIEFVQRLDERLARWRRAIQIEDLDGVDEHAQWLFGSAGTVGYGPLVEPARRTIEAAEQSDWSTIRSQWAVITDLRQRLRVPSSTTQPA